jgi:hypothetical protein
MLGIGSGSFDPETLVVLETAFDQAAKIMDQAFGNGSNRVADSGKKP